MTNTKVAQLQHTEQRFVFTELMKSMRDIEQGRTYSAEEVKQCLDAYLDGLEMKSKA